MLPILTVGAQEPAALRVFGSIFCAREDFKNVSMFSWEVEEFSFVFELSNFALNVVPGSQ